MSDANLGKASTYSRESLDQIKKDIERCNLKIRDNCNVQAQLKKEDRALRETVKLLKLKRHALIFGELEVSS
jgi:septal ring factor EnvC (AmiA/AmiB activator)